MIEVMDWKFWMGVLPIFFISFPNFIYYMYTVYRGRTRPHLFTWLIWGLVTTIAGAAQFSEGAGYGAWVTMFIAGLCYMRAAAAITHGEKNITRGDWVCLVVCLIAIVIWLLLDDPLLSVIIVTFIDISAFYPTVRKSWTKPYEENMQSFWLFGLTFFLSLLAIRDYNLTTVIYPAAMVVSNWVFAAYLTWRRQAVKSLTSNFQV